MSGLSPVSADLIGRLRAHLELKDAPGKGRALALLARAEGAVPSEAAKLNQEILEFLRDFRVWSKIQP